MKYQFDIIRKSRSIIISIADDLSLEQLNKIPEGFKNNIAWNMAHLVVTQQLLCYKLSGTPLLISSEMVELYKKGTQPTRDMTQEELDEVKQLLLSLPDDLERDYNNNVFKNYESYITSANVTLTDIETAIAFNNFHEGIHFGYILALKKLVK